MKKVIERLSSLLSTSKDYIISAGLENQYKEVEGLLKNIPNATTSVLVCGEFKKGKSSFINALLNEEVCPVDRGITTAAVSIIRYGETPKVIRHYGNIAEETNVQKEEVELTSIQDYIKGSSIDIRDTIMLEIEVPNERLKSGLCVIDTPGVGSLDPRHLFLTLYALPKADAIFFMTAAGEPMTETERDFYVHHIASLNKPSRVLLNKADRFSTDAERDIVIADTVKKFTEVNIDDITVLPISAEQWIEYNNSGDDFAKEISNMDAVLTVIEDIRKEQEYGLIKNVASHFVDLINKTGIRVQERLKSLQSGELNEEQAKLQQRIEELTGLQKEIVDANSTLRQKINDIIKESQKKSLADFSDESILLNSTKLNDILTEAFSDKDKGADYAIKKINKELHTMYSQVDSMVQTALKHISVELQQNLDYNNKTDKIARINQDDITQEEGYSMKKIHSLFRQISPNLSISRLGGTVGGGLGLALTGGSLAIGALGCLAGVAATAFIAIKGIRGTLTAQQIAVIKQQISPKLAIALNKIRQYIQDEYDNLQRCIIEALKSSIQHFATEIKETRNQLAVSKGDDKVRQENIIKTQKDLTFIIYVANELKNLPLK